jgi:hypothetical protein
MYLCADEMTGMREDHNPRIRENAENPRIRENDKRTRMQEDEKRM